MRCFGDGDPVYEAYHDDEWGRPQLSEQQLYDIAVNFLRVQLATVQGASIPNPYGGKQAQMRE